jgi:hypothetical protein
VGQVAALLHESAYVARVGRGAGKVGESKGEETEAEEDGCAGSARNAEEVGKSGRVRALGVRVGIGDGAHICLGKS